MLGFWEYQFTVFDSKLYIDLLFLLLKLDLRMLRFSLYSKRTYC